MNGSSSALLCLLLLGCAASPPAGALESLDLEWDPVLAVAPTETRNVGRKDGLTQALAHLNKPLHLLLRPRPQEKSKKQEEPQEAGGFDLGQVDTSDVDSPLHIHGRVDLTLALPTMEGDFDPFRNSPIGIRSGALNVLLDLDDSLRLASEIDYNSFSNNLETELLAFQWQAVPNHVRLQAGVAVVPFGIERWSYAPTLNPLVDRPAVMTRIFPGTFADAGLFVDLRHDFEDGIHFVALEASLTRGLTSPTNAPHPLGLSNDLSPQFTGRLSGQPLNGLTLGVSFLTSQQDDGLDSRLYGLDAVVDLGRFTVASEYVGATTEIRRPGGAVRRRYRSGYYVQASYFWPLDGEQDEDHAIRKLTASVRFGSFNDPLLVPDLGPIHRLAFGLRADLSPHHVVKFEYLLTDDEEGPLRHLFFLQYVFHW